MRHQLRGVLMGLICLMLVCFLLIRCTQAATVPGLDGIDGVEVNPPSPTTAYGYKEGSNWTSWNKFWFSSSIALFGIGDTASTVYQLNGDHCSEGNSLVGSDPSTGVLILGKVVAYGLMWWVTEHLSEGDDETQQMSRNIVYGATALMGGYITTKNMSLDCY